MRVLTKSMLSVYVAVLFYVGAYHVVTDQLEKRSQVAAQQVIHIESKLADPVAIEAFTHNPELQSFALPWMMHAQTLHQTRQIDALGHLIERGVEVLDGYDLFLFMSSTREFVTGYSAVDLAEVQSSDDHKPISVIEAAPAYRKQWTQCLIDLSEHYQQLPDSWVFRLELFSFLRINCSELDEMKRFESAV